MLYLPRNLLKFPVYTSATYKAARTEIAILLHGENVAFSVISLQQSCVFGSVEVVGIWVCCMLVRDALQTDTTNFIKTSSQAGHCATSRKVAGSISDGVFQCFIDIRLLAALWPWCRLSLSQNWVPHQLHLQLSFKSGNLSLLEASGPLQAYTGIALSFFLAIWGKHPDSLHKHRSLCVYLQEGKYSYAKNSCTTLVGNVQSWGHILGGQKRSVLHCGHLYIEWTSVWN
jgi:hypothetical protein